MYLGYGTEVEDSMADKVCREVKRLGTQTAITDVVLSTEQRNMVNYVIGRGNIGLSTRDYLNENMRYAMCVIFITNALTCVVLLFTDTSISTGDQRRERVWLAPPSLRRRPKEQSSVTMVLWMEDGLQTMNWFHLSLRNGNRL